MISNHLRPRLYGDRPNLRALLPPFSAASFLNLMQQERLLGATAPLRTLRAGSLAHNNSPFKALGLWAVETCFCWRPYWHLSSSWVVAFEARVLRAGRAQSETYG
jgi:hypothetical protein